MPVLFENSIVVSFDETNYCLNMNANVGTK
ncbi:Uncharacterised protein [Corynebacterium matruchotii]|uniref:Uncharacterized protein n=1 Tax=Corynebacterium matruchotii TaxID=43768 RepID=A0A8B4H6S6_9CORY|nr:Uncharacterised protein [Corynebacterium matruchotii]